MQQVICFSFYQNEIPLCSYDTNGKVTAVVRNMECSTGIKTFWQTLHAPSPPSQLTVYNTMVLPLKFVKC